MVGYIKGSTDTTENIADGGMSFNMQLEVHGSGVLNLNGCLFSPIIGQFSSTIRTSVVSCATLSADS